jgi:hypothetical protein
MQATNLEHVVALLVNACTLGKGENKNFKERWEKTQEPK